MMRTDSASAILLLVMVLLQTLSSPGTSSPSSSSCLFSSADQEHHDHDHHHSHDHDHDSTQTLAHDHDHAHHDHDNIQSETPAHDHDHGHFHGCTHDHHGHSLRDHDQHHQHKHAPADSAHYRAFELAEELAEEEELRLYGFKSNIQVGGAHHHEHAMSSVGLWMRALGCSLLVSMASLVCLILLPLIVAQGKPSRVVVDFLAAFGAGAMLGDAFLHQLPHALGGSNGHSHSHGAEHEHGHAHTNHNHGHNHQDHDGMGHSHAGGHGHGHGHAHSIQDLSVGLAVLAGIILFFIVEKIVRQVEKASSKGTLPWVHHHHHHHHHHEHDDDDNKQHPEEDGQKTKGEKRKSLSKDDSETSTNGSLEYERESKHKPHRRKKTAGIPEESKATSLLPEKDDSEKKSDVAVIEQTAAPNLILGYLNLFSDGVHNFTDGMALGAAFLNHGTLGGWSRTLFLLAHELPQEVGDFGILVHSGFSVLKALAFNFLSALTALAGTAVALLLGGNAGHSSLIEGFTAGGFIYIAVAGVLPEMHQHGTSTKATCLQLVALSLGISVALSISLVE